MALRVLTVLLFVSFILAPFATADHQTSDIKKWCSETPNPEPCEYFLSQKPNCTSINDKSEFKKLAMQISLDRALRAEGITKKLKFKNKEEKAAWEDCVELYEDTLEMLNKTINEDGKCSHEDSQTWLSAALTNLETCWAGFKELGVTDNLLPLMTSNNVTKLLCNTLAINKVDSSGEQEHKDGYPTWVSKGDRKLLMTPSPAPVADLVVAVDGSGDFTSIQDAIDVAKKRVGNARFVIYVKAGVYSGNVLATKVQNVMLIGDGIGMTILTGSKSVGGGSTTFNSATFAVTGTGFIARDITFRNTAGPENHQAVAMRSGCDLSVFYHCTFEGYQDTLYVHSLRQFYKECDVYGTVDFIFGNAAVVLQNCNLYARLPMQGQQCVYTAQGRSDPNQNTGISIHNCNLLTTPDIGTTRVWLGRPWKEYSRTVYMQSYMTSQIMPAGWMEWSGNFALKTLYYAEYMNTGPGSLTANRVTWGGYRVITSPAEASVFAVGNFIAGDSWLPLTNIPYISSL